MRHTLFILFATVFGLVVGNTSFASDADEQRLDVGASWSREGGKITSQRRRADGTTVLHGVQVIVGPKKQLREYAVYNDGALEQRTQFYPNGNTFRFQRREKNGDGYEVVYAPEEKGVAAVGKIQVFQQERLCLGMVKGDRRWDGTFLVWEPIPNGFGSRLALQEYHEGKLTATTLFSAAKLSLPADVKPHHGWPWGAPDWPSAPQVSRPPRGR